MSNREAVDSISLLLGIHRSAQVPRAMSPCSGLVQSVVSGEDHPSAGKMPQFPPRGCRQSLWHFHTHNIPLKNIHVFTRLLHEAQHVTCTMSIVRLSHGYDSTDAPKIITTEELGRMTKSRGLISGKRWLGAIERLIRNINYQPKYKIIKSELTVG